MRIGLRDMDNRIADELKARLAAPKSELFWTSFWFPLNTSLLRRMKRPSEEKHLLPLVQQRERPFLWRVEATFATSFFLTVCALLLLFNEAPAFYLFSNVTALAATTTFGVWRSRFMHPVRQLERNVTLEEMNAVFPILRLTRAERVYCDALQMLARTETDSTTEHAMRDAMRQLNDLMKNGRLLESRRANLIAIKGMNVLNELQAEYGALGRKLDAATDAVTRQSIQQSLQMCAARLQNARNIEQSLERLNAQQEAIVQTLATTLSAMARLQAAPDVRAEAAANEIAETVAQMNRQTYAMEQAVEEVITLRAGA